MASLTITTQDGYPLSATYVEPQESVKDRVILINPAMGVKQTFYHEYAKYLAAQGFGVLTYDYRGIGQSRQGSLKGFGADLLNWARDDQGAMVNWLQTEQSGQKILVVGHSLGGQLVGLLPDPSAIHAVAGVAAQSGYWRLWPLSLRPRVMALWFGVIPILTPLVGYFPASKVGMGSDAPAKVVQEWAAACRRPRYLADFYKDSPHQHYNQVIAPILAYSFADDWYAPAVAVEALLKLYPNAQGTHRHIVPQAEGLKGVGHFGYFRERIAGKLWPAQVEWLATI